MGMNAGGTNRNFGDNSGFGMSFGNQNNNRFGNLPSPQLKALQDQVAQLQGIQATSNRNIADPFTPTMSGTEHNTLQPYINQQTQMASDALNGGLLGQSMPMQSGNAGGMPMTATQPQFNLQGALANFKGFGNRAWMDK